jgi:hypothetical protein
MYGCEAWFNAEMNKLMLSTWDRKILRMVYGQITEQVALKIKTNEELGEFI